MFRGVRLTDEQLFNYINPIPMMVDNSRMTDPMSTKEDVLSRTDVSQFFDRMWTDLKSTYETLCSIAAVNVLPLVSAFVQDRKDFNKRAGEAAKSGTGKTPTPTQPNPFKRQGDTHSEGFSDDELLNLDLNPQDLHDFGSDVDLEDADQSRRPPTGAEELGQMTQSQESQTSSQASRGHLTMEKRSTFSSLIEMSLLAT